MKQPGEQPENGYIRLPLMRRDGRKSLPKIRLVIDVDPDTYCALVAYAHVTGDKGIYGRVCRSLLVEGIKRRVTDESTAWNKRQQDDYDAIAANLKRALLLKDEIARDNAEDEYI